MQSIETRVRTIRQTTYWHFSSVRVEERGGGGVAQEEKASVPPEAIYVLVVVRADLVTVRTFVEEDLVAFVYLSWLKCRCGGAGSQRIWRFN